LCVRKYVKAIDPVVVIPCFRHRVGKSFAKAPTLKPRFRVVCGKDIALGPGKVELLALLVETGSLNAAARRAVHNPW
jgi:hypothetical protein